MYAVWKFLFVNVRIMVALRNFEINHGVMKQRKLYTETDQWLISLLILCLLEEHEVRMRVWKVEKIRVKIPVRQIKQKSRDRMGESEAEIFVPMCTGHWSFKGYTHSSVQVRNFHFTVVFFPLREFDVAIKHFRSRFL